MSKYAIAFIAPTETAPLRHKIIESETKDSALRTFFNEEASEFYSNDEQGYYYFKDDFYDQNTSSGSIIEIQ
ncbi:MAG: hypothetical protein GX640_03795 [Fibrobacter sp.]|nr:hypothetical protein [Fibrobacter sp.]